MMIRKPYLITQAIKTYILASILTTTIGQVNGLVDSVLMGNILGPEALGAITLSLPVIALSSIVFVLLAAGAAILAGKAIGERDFVRASRIFTISITSLLVVGTTLSVTAWLTRDQLTAWLCQDPKLTPYVRDYLGWMLGLSVITVFSQALAQFTDVDGHPRKVARAMVITLVLNTLFDILLVAWLGMGIAGSAIASAISCGASATYLLWHTATATKSYRLLWQTKGSLTLLADNIKNGVTMMVMTVMGAAGVMFLNHLVLSRLGSDGMFVLSVATSLIAIGMFLSQGASQAYLAVGSMLYGQRDYRGLHLLFNRCLFLVMVLAVVLTLMGQILPEVFVRLYGANTPELIAMAARGLRIATLMFIPALLLSLMPSVYQVLGYLKLVVLLTVSFFAMLLSTLWLFSLSDTPENLWYAFPLSSWVGMVVFAVVLWFVHRSMPGTSQLTLIPHVAPYHQMMDVSVAVTEEAVAEVMQETHQFVQRLDVTSGALKNNVEVCVEEMLFNIVRYSGLSEKQYVDLRITSTNDEILVMLKDNGRAFDPVTVSSDKQHLGLALAKALSSKMEYKYMYGQNMTFLSWSTNDAENSYRPAQGLDVDKLLEPAQDAGATKMKYEGPLLSLRGIHKTYPGATPLHVLKGVDLDIQEGELVSIMGASGSGKSTLLNVIGILDDYDEGEYRLGGHLIKNLSEDEEADFRNELIGFIFQTFNLINYKNALDNVALPLMYRGVDRETRNRLALEYLEKVGLGEHWNHTPMEMSGGQRQRVAIARALIQHPKIILADEPTGALDSKTTQEVMDMLREVNRKEGQTVIIVTHEQEIADQTDRRIFFKDGLIFRDERAES